MTKYIYSILLTFLTTTSLFGQNLTQTVRGTVTDEDNNRPMTGVQVIIEDSNPTKGTSTDADGKFKLEKVPTGRINLRLSHVGYETVVVSNLVVNSSKEVFLTLHMQESVSSMEDLVVTPDQQNGEPVNAMNMISSRAISPEETNRYAGGIEDPARILSSFAGITNSQTGEADIIVRGNSPKYVQWQLEGVPVTAPYHYADQNGSGSLSVINNKLLATSDFSTGAFSPEYGNALSGVYDVSLRRGNNERFESMLGVGVTGTDLTVEGPFHKNYDGSYLANYRYSTITMINEVGLMPEIGGIPKFLDGSFKFYLPTQSWGNFSVFGLAGLSSFSFEEVTPAFQQTPGEQGQNPDIEEDYKKETYLVNNGLKHTLSLSENSFLRTTLAFSREGLDDTIYEISPQDTTQNGTNKQVLNFNSRIRKSVYRVSQTYHHKLNSNNNLRVGFRYALFDNEYKQSRLEEDHESRFMLTDFRANMSIINSFVSWKYRINQDITMVSGLHNMNVLFNDKHTLEPRFALNWAISNTGSIHAGYGNHSTMERMHHYFTRVEEGDGSIIQPNRDLGLLRAHHYVLGYEKQLAAHWRAKLELYYQDLYDLPVENNTSSSFSTINEGMDFRYVDLVNEGTGKNYGVEMTLEKFFANSYYFLVNGSLYNSKYTALDGVERNTKFNSNFLVNFLGGKEITGLGKKRNQVLALNAKVFWGGGHKIIPLLRNDEGELAVDTEQNQYYDYNRAYEYSLDNIFVLDLSVSYKWNRANTTHELFLNIDNLTNHESRLGEYYDPEEPNSIGYVTQSFFFPNLMYRLYF